MPSDDLNIVIIDSDRSTQLSVPVAPEKLGKFISSLLGQPQTIERDILGTLSVGHPWLLHLHAVIDQRVKQQHNASRTGFKATVFYEDGLERTVDSYEAFHHFAETKKVRSTAVKLKWTYLIMFPGRELPEKQEITLRVMENAPFFTRMDGPLGRRIFESDLGYVNYSIAHTERTWGDDLEAILRQEIDKVVSKKNLRTSVFEKAMGILALLFCFGGLLLPEYTNDRLQVQHLEEIKSLTAQIATSVTPSNPQTKLDLILAYTDPANAIDRVGTMYRTICFVLGLALMAWCVSLSEITPKSFVILTEEAESHKQKVRAKEGRKIYLAIGSFILSIAAGVAGNYIYLYMHG